jgi:cytochrome c oxidase subunit 3
MILPFSSAGAAISETLPANAHLMAMASQLFRTKTPRPSIGGNGRTPFPPEPFGGGGGGGRGDGDRIPNPNERLRRYRMGLSLAVASISMLFLAFTTLFLARRAAGKFDPIAGKFITDWVPVHLPSKLLLINTGFLLLSCITIEIARRAASIEMILVPATSLPGIKPTPEHSITWVRLTAALGTLFLAGQWLAWNLLHRDGIFFNSGPASSFAFLLTGAHAVHLVAGVLVLIYAGFHRRQRRSLESRRIVIDVAAWYWHFMGLLWLYLLALLWFLK